MSTSEHKPPARVTANRVNATRSTGPKTQAGKAASSRNSVRHGCYAGPEPIGTGPFAENPDDLEAFKHGIFEQLAPRDDLERGAAEQLVRHYVQARRLGVFEDSTLTAAGTLVTNAR